MATLGGTAVTLTDVLKLTDPKGAMAQIVEILDQTNDMLADMTWIEANDGDSHETTIRTGLPEATWRRYNRGVPNSKSTTAQVRCQTGMLEARSRIDRDLAEKGGNLAGARMAEAVAHLEGLNQQMAASVLYDDERVDPERITGIMAHYASADTAVAESAENVIDAQGSGSDNASIMLVVWGPTGITGIYPKGTVAGLQREDKNIQQVPDEDGNMFDAYVDVFRWKAGVCVKDWQQGGRIANIDINDLEDDPDGSTVLLINYMTDLSERIRNLNSGNAAFYMPRRVRTVLRMQIRNKAQNTITLETVAGKKVLMFDGIPVRRADAMMVSEDAI